MTARKKNHPEAGDDRAGMVKAPAVAEYVGTTVANLTRLRSEGKGPNYIRLNRSIRYRWADVDAWVEGNLQANGEDS
jgi:predicted DNA-binding transcriptional regulator AlpA